MTAIKSTPKAALYQSKRFKWAYQRKTRVKKEMKEVEYQSRQSVQIKEKEKMIIETDWYTYFSLSSYWNVFLKEKKLDNPQF